MGAPCAVKLFDSSVAGDDLLAARFRAECAHHTRASSCPHILPIQTAGIDGCLILRWAHHGDLERRVQVGGSPSHAEVIRIVSSLLVACTALQRIDIVHRDIKPSNILLDRDSIWLADFGLAAHREPSGAWRSVPDPWREIEIGTPHWVAPELVIDPAKTSPANDVYGIARVWLALSPSVSPAEASLCHRMLDPSPTARPSAGEALAELQTHA